MNEPAAQPASLPVAPIAPRLAAVTTDAASVSRLVFDARFQRWMHALLRQRVLFGKRPLTEASALLEVEAAQGLFQVMLSSSQWPALDMALALEDDESACAVATHLMAPFIQALAPLLGHMRVVRRKRRDAKAARPVEVTLIGAGMAAVGLHRVDARLVGHLRQGLASAPAGALRTFGALTLPGRLVLMVRLLPTDVLARLGRGDTVLLEAAPRGQNVYRLIYGRGRTMQVPAQLNPGNETLVAHGPPQLADDAQHMPEPHAVDELQVPVSFEVDTARVSLAELASMRPGYVIELDQPVSSAPVRLVCHGQTVGHGQLVAIGEQMGVRILSMGLPGVAKGTGA